MCSLTLNTYAKASEEIIAIQKNEKLSSSNETLTVPSSINIHLHMHMHTQTPERKTTLSLQSSKTSFTQGNEKKKQNSRFLPRILKIQGIVHITSTLNNTFLTCTDVNGNVFTRTTAGACGFKSSRRSTRYAAQVAGYTLAKKCVSRFQISKVRVKVKGLGYGKQSSIKGLFKGGLRIVHIQDITSIPFNGCRPPKPIRVKKRNKKK